MTVGQCAASTDSWLTTPMAQFHFKFPNVDNVDRPSKAHTTSFKKIRRNAMRHTALYNSNITDSCQQHHHNNFHIRTDISTISSCTQNVITSLTMEPHVIGRHKLKPLTVWAITSCRWTEWWRVFTTKQPKASARARTYCDVDRQVAIVSEQCRSMTIKREAFTGADYSLNNRLNTVWCTLPRKSTTTFL